jgi:cytochrome c oxidase assembly protein subunit 15
MNKKRNYKIIRIVSFILLFSIFLQIILGAWVRLTGSGMSCPDWPLCYGFWIPTPSKVATIAYVEFTYFQIFLEWIHRANAAFIIGPICLVFSLFIIFKKNIDHIFKKYAYLLMVLIFIQGGLGGLTVFKSNIPWSVAIHLIFAFLLYLATFIIIIRTYDIRNNQFIANNSIKILTFFCGLLTMIAAALGAFTSKYGASLSCNSWPGCESNFFPSLNDSFQIIHFSHRVTAFLLTLAIFTLFIMLRSHFKKLSKILKKILYSIFSIILFQIVIGGLLIYMEVPIWMGIFHQATALLLFTFIVLFYLHINLTINKA